MLCVVSSTSNAQKCYIACILPSTKKSGKIAFRSHQRLQREIWCNCGAFAPYFFYFSLAPLVGDGSPVGRTGGMGQLWRGCAVFFSFASCSWSTPHQSAQIISPHCLT